MPLSLIGKSRHLGCAGWRFLVERRWRTLAHISSISVSRSRCTFLLQRRPINPCRPVDVPQRWLCVTLFFARAIGTFSRMTWHSLSPQCRTARLDPGHDPQERCADLWRSVLWNAGLAQALSSFPNVVSLGKGTPNNLCVESV